MKTITFTGSIGFVITGTNHKDIDSKQILSICLMWSWQANRFGKQLPLITWHTLSWFGVMPLSWTIGINSASTWGCWPCQKQWINQIFYLGIWTSSDVNDHLWVCHMFCVHQFLWFHFTLPKVNCLWALWQTNYVLRITLNYPNYVLGIDI